MHKCDPLAAPAKIELKLWSDSSDEENIDPKEEKNGRHFRRPDSLALSNSTSSANASLGDMTIVVPTIVTPIDEVIT